MIDNGGHLKFAIHIYIYVSISGEKTMITNHGILDTIFSDKHKNTSRID
jgi:hypothetical protein